MMLTVKEFIALLKIKFPTVAFFNSTIRKDSDQCIGVYPMATGKIPTVGGPNNGSYDILPISIVIHWTEDAGDCEVMADAVYSKLLAITKEATPSGIVITFIQPQDSSPVHVGRDERNIIEKVIRANIFYERGV